MLNNGSGGFTAGSSYTLPSGYEAKGVAVGNFTGHANGTLDIAVLLASTSTDAYSVAVYTGNGNGTFATPVITAAGNGVASGPQPDSIAAADFNGDGKTDLAFTTDDGLADVMLATSGGSMGSATEPDLPSGHLAIGVTTSTTTATATPTWSSRSRTPTRGERRPFVALDLLTATARAGSAILDLPDRRPDRLRHASAWSPATSRAPPWASRSPCPSPTAAAGTPTSTSSRSRPPAPGATGQSSAPTIGSYVDDGTSTTAGQHRGRRLQRRRQAQHRAVNGGTGQIQVLLADPASNQFLPVETVHAGVVEQRIGMLAVAPFMGTAATVVYRGPTSDPSTLVQNSDGSWTRTYPDGTVIQFNSSGQETSESDRNGNTFTYAYVTSGAAAGALATITDPVGLDHDPGL